MNRTQLLQDNTSLSGDVIEKKDNEFKNKKRKKKQQEEGPKNSTPEKLAEFTREEVFKIFKKKISDESKKKKIQALKKELSSKFAEMFESYRSTSII